MKLPESQHTTAAAIVKWYEAKPQEHRPHMGMSIIGHECERYVWNTWRWTLKPNWEGRMLRLFDSGVRAEPRFLEELRAIGAEVWDVDPDTGLQWRVSACNGHLGGSLDSVARGLPEAPKTVAVIECKTHNDKSFNDLLAKGVKESKPQHFIQMNGYMGLMDISRALYLAENKNTAAVYTEWVHFDEALFKATMQKAERLIGMTEPPPRISEDPAHWQCKMCNFHPVCHGRLAAEANCRTCCHASPVENGAWRCEQHSKELPDAAQRKGCEDHLMIPALVAYAEAVDGGSSWVAYKHKASGKHFVNGEKLPDTTYGPCFSSAELHNCPAELLPDTLTVKEQFPDAKVVSGSLIDMPSDDLDAVPTKREMPGTKEKKARITETMKALQSFQPATVSKPAGSLGEDA